MRKVLFYLKRSYKSIIVIIALLVVQAMCDLTLPDYTSKIIDVGVQQGGIEEGVFSIVRKDKLDEILLFTEDDVDKEVLSYYKELDKNSLKKSEYDSLKQKYPSLDREVLYELKDLSNKEKDELEERLANAILVDYMLTSKEEEAVKIQEQIRENLPSQMASLDLITIFKQMPQANLDKLLSSMDEMFASFPDSIRIQSAIAAIKVEYENIGMDTAWMETSYILIAGLKMLALALVSMSATILVSFLGSRVAARLARDLREGTYEKVLSFGPTEFKKFGVASLITRSTNDIQQVQMLIVMTLRVICYAPIIGIGGVFKALQTNASMAWIIAVAVMAVISLVITVFMIAMPKFKKVQKLIDKLNQVSREILNGIPVIRAFSNQKHEEERFDEANEKLRKTMLFVDRVMAVMMPTMMFVMNGICILIVWQGAKGIDSGAMQVGEMMAFIQYTMQIVMSFLMISMFSIIFPRANVSMGRISEVLNTNPAVVDPENPKSFGRRIKGLVEFKNVSFRYPDSDEDVLTDITFTSEPGTTTAFIGSTGSGKSTLINLIPRLYDVTKGEILVDGVNINQVTLHDLHEKIGFVPQKGVLFSGTIESNILYGNPNGTKEEMMEAARIAQATDFIEEKKDGYESAIAQGGTNVSGGQKQRLSIARAIATHPEIYIFDDSFSALDFKTDAELRKALYKSITGSTVFIVAQRVSTIMHADQIVVLDEGKVKGIGKHQDLLKNCPIYREIAESQLTKEELDN